MKRSFNILLALLLSLMVVYMSVGITVMHCLRYDKMMVVGMVPDCCQKRCLDHKGCQGHEHGLQFKKHCMDVKHIRLSPTRSVQMVDFTMTPAFAGIQQGTWRLVPHPMVSEIQKAKGWDTHAPHSPPRKYLSLLNTLII